MTEPQPAPVQAPQMIQQPQMIQPPKRKWWQMAPETKKTIWEIKWLICTFLVMCLTQILQPLLAEIMASEMKIVWKTYSSIIIPTAITIGCGIIMKFAQGKKANHLQNQPQQQYQQYQQMPGQYMQQGAQYGQGLITQGQQVGTNFIQQGGQYLQGAVQQGVQAIPQVPQVVVQPTPTPAVVPTEPKVEPTG